MFITILFVLVAFLVLFNSITPGPRGGKVKKQLVNQYTDPSTGEVVGQIVVEDFDLSIEHCEALEKFEAIGITFSDSFIEKFATRKFSTVEKAIQYIEVQRRKSNGGAF